MVKSGCGRISAPAPPPGPATGLASASPASRKPLLEIPSRSLFSHAEWVRRVRINSRPDLIEDQPFHGEPRIPDRAPRHVGLTFSRIGSVAGNVELKHAEIGRLTHHQESQYADTDDREICVTWHSIIPCSRR